MEVNPLNNADSFWLQDNAIVLRTLESLGIWKHQKNNLFFTIWDMFWNISRTYVSFFSIQNIKSNCYVIFLKHFAISLFWWKKYSFLVIFIYIRFNFCYFLRMLFYFFYDLKRLFQHIENISYHFYWWYLLLLSCFLSNRVNVCMIHHNSDLFYDI